MSIDVSIKHAFDCFIFDEDQNIVYILLLEWQYFTISTFQKSRSLFCSIYIISVAVRFINSSTNLCQIGCKINIFHNVQRFFVQAEIYF